MLKLRLSRTGKNRQPTFRLVVQEHTAPIKGRFVEEIGYYRPTTPDKPFTIDSERVKHWISVGARPSDTVATLLKKQGFEGMEQYMEPRNKKRKKKGQSEGTEGTGAPQQEKTEIKKEETAPSASEASAPSEEKPEAKKEGTAPAAEKAQPEAPAEESPKSES